MLITLARKIFSENSTMGELSIDGNFECYTLEDIPLNEKIPGKTSILYGMYQVIISFSDRFHKLMPLLLNVSGFEGIRIHSGNTAEETDGCILVGQTKETDFIGNIRAVFKSLYPKFQSACRREKFWVEIKK